MKRLIGILIISIALLCAAQVFAADYPAEIAEPSEAVVAVDGNAVDFCAYNLYGSNYFMLRDVAAALNGTDKQFNVDWANNAVSLTSETAYESVGTEFSQNADSSTDALFSVPAVTLDGTETTLVGYNINGSNYFKIRDIARIFDFNIGYEYGHISIDTAEQYAPEMPYDSGRPNVGSELIGMAHEADFALFINEIPIVSYYTAVDTAYNETQLARINENPRLNGVYVSARDLENYGFDVYLDDGIWLTRNKDKKFGMLDGEIINSAPIGISEVYASDTKVYLDGANTRNIMINGEQYISAAELLKYSNVSEQYGMDYSSNKKLINRVNIDFLCKDLIEEFEAEQGGEEKDLMDNENVKATDFPDKQWKYFGGTSFKKTNTWHYEISNSLDYSLDNVNHEKYIGQIVNGKLNGMGILENYTKAGDGPSREARYSWGFKRGEFKNGELIDGIFLLHSGSYYHERTEGAFINGYKRKSETKIYNDSQYRFGYRVVCEGTIENGEYVGYYREYDEDGKLIFEGNYNDWVK